MFLSKARTVGFIMAAVAVLGLAGPAAGQPLPAPAMPAQAVMVQAVGPGGQAVMVCTTANASQPGRANLSIAECVQQADAVVLGKVSKVEKHPVSLPVGPKGQEKRDYQVAVIEIKEALKGA